MCAVAASRTYASWCGGLGGAAPAAASPAARTVLEPGACAVGTVAGVVAGGATGPTGRPPRDADPLTAEATTAF